MRFIWLCGVGSVVALLLLAVSGSVHAQPPSVAAPRAASIAHSGSSREILSAPRNLRDDNDTPRKPADVVLRTMLVTGAPRGFQTVRIPVPAEYSAKSTPKYVVFSSGTAPILGRLEGIIAPADGQRAITLTIGIPGDALAGQTPVGSVLFSAANAPSIEVPIALQVNARRGVQLTVVEELRAVRAGARVMLSYRLSNLGNATDTIEVRAALPQGWRADGGDGRTLLAAGATVLRTMHVTSAPDAQLGRYSIRLSAYSGARLLAGTDALLELTGQGNRAQGVNSGPSLRIGAVGTRGAWDGTPVGFTYALDGKLTESIDISARAVSAPAANSAAGMALSRTGVGQQTPSVILTAREWRVAAGPIGGALSELTGVNVGGEGASVVINKARWGVNAMAIQPNRLQQGSGVKALFAQVARQAGKARISTSVSSVRDVTGPAGGTRELDAISAGVDFGSSISRRSVSELAYRRYDEGAGLGASSALSLRDENGAIELRGSFAAGGSAAFARGTRDLSMSASRRLSSWLGVNVASWNLADSPTADRALTSSGWTVSANANSSSALAASLGARSFGYSTAATTGGFSSADRAAFGTVQAHVGPLRAGLDGSFGTRTRSMNSPSAATAINDRTLTSRLGSTVGLAGRAGSFSIVGSVTDNGMGGGFPPHQFEYGANLDQLSLIRSSLLRLTAGGSAIRSTSFVTPGSWLTVLRGSITGELPFGVSIALDAEKNPLYQASLTASSATNQWMYALRVERSIRLPRLTAGSRSEGLVFSDMNGDGVRSKGEAGVADIVLRRGAETAVTDKNGRYRFPGVTTVAIEMDVRSLPMGIISSRNSVLSGGDFALVALAPVDVKLVVARSDSARVRDVDLAKAVVIARDSSGRIFLARAMESGSARFDALPPGRYVTSVDFSMAAEPLRANSESSEFVVGTSRTLPILFQVQPRPLRFPVAKGPGADSTVRAVGEPKAGPGSAPVREIPRP